MNLSAYLNLSAVLRKDHSDDKEKRAFGLAHKKEKNEPVELLLLWMQEHLGILNRPLLSEKICAYLYGITLSLGILAFFIGLFSGVALLSYSGHKPVNVIYFMAMVVLLPLATMALALFSMFRAHISHSFLIHLSPAYWLERILRLLPVNAGHVLKEFQINPAVLNWLIIKRSQLLALFFSTGLLLALLGVIVTKDIAFAWSTTLHITPESFHRILELVSWPWKDWFPSAVPSLELIEQSQYFRLGEKLDSQMLANAPKLGEWWKFLAFATLFYAIILRLLMWTISFVGYRHVLKRSLLNLEGAQSLLNVMNEPLITTTSPLTEKSFSSSGNHYFQELKKLDSSYDRTFFWAMSKKDMKVLNEIMHILTPVMENVGGNNTLDEDKEIVLTAKGEVLLYVKAWEPPTNEFMDFIEDMINVSDKIIVVPVGMADDNYLPREKWIAIWGKKLQGLENGKIWLKI